VALLFNEDTAIQFQDNISSLQRQWCYTLLHFNTTVFQPQS